MNNNFLNNLFFIINFFFLESESDDEATDEYFPCLYKYGRTLYDRYAKQGLMNRSGKYINVLKKIINYIFYKIQ